MKMRLFKYIETTKNWKLLEKNSDIFFHNSDQNIDCGYSLEPPRRGGSNEYPQSMFLLAEIWKKMSPAVNPSFTVYKWGLRESKLYRYVFRNDYWLVRPWVYSKPNIKNVITLKRFLDMILFLANY